MQTPKVRFYTKEELNSIRYGDKEKNIGLWSTKIDINMVDFVSRPPENSSTTTMNELMKLSRMTSTASSESISKALLLDKNLSHDFEVILNKYKIEFPKKSFNEAWKVISDYIMYFKWFFNRPRPSQIMTQRNVEINVNTPESANTPSYPSGHTAYAETIKIILARQYPFLENLDDAVENMAVSRMLLGVHYPSDNLASVQIVNELFNKLHI